MTTEQTVCGDCRQRTPAFSHTHCATTYQPPVSLWVHQLKFGGQLERAAVLAAAMAPLLDQVPKNVPVIPVPLHINRLRKRGYNQALEVARLLVRDQHRPLLTDVLVRHQATRMQAELSEAERRRNVRGAFSVNKPLNAQRVLLLDDVMTTGQTLHAASECLRQAGVQQVEAVVFARSG
jgi:ComF family protein